MMHFVRNGASPNPNLISFNYYHHYPPFFPTYENTVFLTLQHPFFSYPLSSYLLPLLLSPPVSLNYSYPPKPSTTLPHSYEPAFHLRANLPNQPLFLTPPRLVPPPHPAPPRYNMLRCLQPMFIACCAVPIAMCWPNTVHT